MYGCFYGKRLDSPLVTHIDTLLAKKVLPGEPCLINTKYMILIKYDAKKWFTEYKRLHKIEQDNSSYLKIIKNALI